MKQYIVTSLNQFLNETLNSTEYFNLSEIVDDEIRVYESSIRELCRGIGEGIDDIDIISKSMSGVWIPNTNEIQNEICITFIENAWGGISIDEWNGVDKKLKQLEGKNGFYSFCINPNRNLITLEFDSDLPLGLY